MVINTIGTKSQSTSNLKEEKGRYSKILPDKKKPWHESQQEAKLRP